MLLELFRLLQTPIGDQFPGFLAQGAVGLFEVTAHLDECFFLAAKLHRQRAAEFLILLAELGFLGFERDVFRAIQFDVQLSVSRSKTT